MTGSALPETVDILGAKIHNATADEALKFLEGFIASGKPNLIVTLGTEMVMECRRSAAFRSLANRAALVLPDGGGVIWASKVLGSPLRERVAGIDFLEAVCRVSAQKGWKVFFLGGRPGVARKAAENIRTKFPGTRIVGTHPGYFESSASEVLSELKKSKPDILFAGLGSPRQEFWLEAHLPELGIPAGIGVGGSFDVLAGNLKRAPAWMMRSNLEWLFRFFQEPRRFRRILKIPYFMGCVYAASLKKKPGKKNS